MPAVMTIHDPATLHTLAETLPDTPETVISLHTLRRGLCTAHIVGTVENYTALVIDSSEVPGEPSCYGDAPDAIWQILRDLPGWFAANMRENVAEAVGAYVETEWGDAVVYYGDPHFILRKPAPRFSDPGVRLLTPDDLVLLETASDAVRGAGFGSIHTMLEDGIVAAAVVDNAVVAIAHTSAMTELHADIGVATLEPFRGRGYATTAAALVASAIQASGRTPVWSCGEANHASLRVAAKLGFEPALRRVYVVVESRRSTAE